MTESTTDPSHRATLEAVVFDVDGTLADSERHGHLVAFNMAFEAFDLPYRWDENLYRDLLRTTGGVRRIDRYLGDQGVDEAERKHLAPELHERKTAILNDLVDQGRVGLRPGVRRLVDELVGAGVAVAVATTGSRGWVDRMLGRLLPEVKFGAVVTGDDVKARKPDPEAFLVALDRLALGPDMAVAVEDSHEGLASAKAAGLATVVVVNDYTSDHDVSIADLVLDGFGEPGRPASVLVDGVDSGCTGILDVATVARLLERRTSR